MALSSLASQIHPFPQVAAYPTSWAGELTFDQIYHDLAHYASNVMKRNGFRPREISECLQNGFMVLWETLVQQHDFLAEKTRRQSRRPADRRSFSLWRGARFRPCVIRRACTTASTH